MHNPDNDDSWVDLCSSHPSYLIDCLLLDTKRLTMKVDVADVDGICRRELSGFHTGMK